MISERSSLEKVSPIFTNRKTLVIGGRHSLRSAVDRIDSVVHDYDLMEITNNLSGKNLSEKIDSQIEIVLGVGGCSKLDSIKHACQIVKKPMFAYPTIFSTDGISSRFCSIRDCSLNPLSLPTSYLYGVIAELHFIDQVDERYLRSGVSDVISNITASYASSDLLSSRFSNLIGQLMLNTVSETGLKDRYKIVSLIVESGSAVAEDNSTRSISGFEHNIVHVLTLHHGSTRYMHGEIVGVSTIITSFLQNQDWRKILDTLYSVGCPVLPNDLGIENEEMIRMVKEASLIRSDRITPKTHKNLLSDEYLRKALKTIENYVSQIR